MATGLAISIIILLWLLFGKPKKSYTDFLAEERETRLSRMKATNKELREAYEFVSKI
jgi:hypothetical protein